MMIPTTDSAHKLHVFSMGKLLIYLCCFLFFVFVPSTLGDWQDGDDGVDRPSGDLILRPIELNLEATPSDCATLCTSYKFSGCKGWVFFKRDCGGQIKPTCRLKDTLNKQTNNSCAVSSKFDTSRCCSFL